MFWFIVFNVLLWEQQFHCVVFLVISTIEVNFELFLLYCYVLIGEHPKLFSLLLNFYSSLVQFVILLFLYFPSGLLKLSLYNVFFFFIITFLFILNVLEVHITFRKLCKRILLDLNLTCMVIKTDQQRQLCYNIHYNNLY